MSSNLQSDHQKEVNDLMGQQTEDFGCEQHGNEHIKESLSAYPSPSQPLSSSLSPQQQQRQQQEADIENGQRSSDRKSRSSGRDKLSSSEREKPNSEKSKSKSSETESSNKRRSTSSSSSSSSESESREREPGERNRRKGRKSPSKDRKRKRKNEENEIDNKEKEENDSYAADKESENKENAQLAALGTRTVSPALVPLPKPSPPLTDSDDEQAPLTFDDSFGDSSDMSGGDEHDGGVLASAEPKVFHLPALSGCRLVDEFARLNKIDEGTFGVVYRARDKITGEIVALKRIKIERDQPDFPITSLREINILMAISHPNIVALKEIVTERREDSVFMVMEYMDHDLKMLMRSMPQPFRQADVKCLLKQLLEGVAAMHELWIIHRDLKTSNLLLNNKGILKICDFGLARKYGSPIGRYSKNVVTLYYRAPELLLGADVYSSAIDMWSVGCIFAEFLTKEHLFPGSNEFDQIGLIFKLLGTPKVSEWPDYVNLPHVKTFQFRTQPVNRLREMFPRDSLIGGVYLSDHGFDLLSSMLCYNPEKRITAKDALKHPYFTERPFPQDPRMMPTFPSLNEGGVNAALRDKLKKSTSSINDVKHQRALQETRESEGFFLG